MKKSLVAVALLGAFAGVAHAQTAVQIYGTVDAGVVKRTDQTVAIGKRAANTLGFKGTEDLGNGLKALFQLEIRYEPDTGTVENNTRPLFQGQSRVGLQGDFGMVRLGRGLTPFQEVVGSFEPFHGLPTPAGFYTDISVAGFNSAPLDSGANAAGSGANTNRISNAIFYNSPVTSGFQVNASWATKEAVSNGTAITGIGAGSTSYAAGAQASANPFSVAATYNNGPAAAMLAYERNAVESKVWSGAGSFAVNDNLKLMATYSHQNLEHTNTLRPEIRAWLVGATYGMGPGKFLAGYGQKHQENTAKTKQLSLGYEYNLSKRTYLYVDAARKKNIVNAITGNLATTPTVNHYDVGVNHSF
ncbi:porin [Massilia forsythiae]|uniref:Porin n=1 Tax=Massilia forsythiae TaxID=2728020 RepID=A0A7Z2ZRU1_9BURK|nr:porin [Massilia forsythiae]QJD99785.1 porin [Massilia forsythiae]